MSTLFKEPFNPSTYRDKIREKLEFLSHEAVIGFAARCAWRTLPLLVDQGTWLWKKPNQTSKCLTSLVGSLSLISRITDFSISKINKISVKSGAFATLAADAADDASDIAAETISDDAARAAARATYVATRAATRVAYALSYAADDASYAALYAAYSASYTAGPVSNNLYSSCRSSQNKDLRILADSELERYFGRPLYSDAAFETRIQSWRSECSDLGLKDHLQIWDGIHRGKPDWELMESFANTWLKEVKREKAKTATRSTKASRKKTSKKDNDQTEIRSWDHRASGVATDLPQTQLTRTALQCCLALKAFLLHKNTRPPLTVAVEAPWGVGKSSLMLRLQEEMEKEDIPTIWFNPWKYEAGKSLWAAFALAFERQLAAKQSWIKRIWIRFRLGWQRMSWKERFGLTVRLSLWLGGIGILTWAFVIGWGGVPNSNSPITYTMNWLGKRLGIGFALTAATAGFVRDLIKHLGSPFKTGMDLFSGGASYAEQMDDLHRFHEDFLRMLKVYGKPKIAVFIDDLDRCEAPKAAELLQSLHLMMHAQEDGAVQATQESLPGLFYILGMDRGKVAAAVAAKHSKLLPFLIDTHDKDSVSSRQALCFGHEFLDKFVNLTLHLPVMVGDDLEEYLTELCGTQTAEPNVIASGSSDPTPSHSEAASGSKVPKPKTEVQVPRQDLKVIEAELAEERSKRAATLDVDSSPHILECARMVAPALDGNPRKLKQFVNMLRLRMYVAATMDVLYGPQYESLDHKSGQRHLSLFHLAKLVALELKEPDLMHRARKNESPHHVIKSWKEQQADTHPMVNIIDHGAAKTDASDVHQLGPENLRTYFHLIAPASET